MAAKRDELTNKFRQRMAGEMYLMRALDGWQVAAILKLMRWAYKLGQGYNYRHEKEEVTSELRN